MGKKRKRPAKHVASAPGNGIQDEEAAEHPHPVISLYYPRVVTLRQYLLQQIPVSSKSRRRRIASVRLDDPSKQSGRSGDQASDLASLLDTTLIGVLNDSPSTSSKGRRRELADFTQSQSKSQLASTDTGPTCAQAEIVDFVISSLFNRSGFSYKPHHLLTHGFQRAYGPRSRARNVGAPTCNIPGIVDLYPNKNVQALKKSPWTDVLNLLGSNGEEIMIRLLFDCGIFKAIDETKGVYHQMSGLPLSILEPAHKDPQQCGPNPKRIALAPIHGGSQPHNDGRISAVSKNNVKPVNGVIQKPNSIVFFRRRMLYARAAVNLHREILFGLASRHVLNRYTSESLSQTVHVMKYIFPKQFRLHNVFTSVPNNRETSLPFNDYFTREEEIINLEKLRGPSKIPKRLRGKVTELVQQLQNRHKHCSYTQLLKYYCPVESVGPWKFGPVDSQTESVKSNADSSAPELLKTQLRGSYEQPTPIDCDHGQYPDIRGNLACGQSTTTASNPVNEPRGAASKLKVSLTDYATPSSSVSAFCRAVLRKLVPPQFYGIGQCKRDNEHIVLRHVDRFVRMRRFESLSIHEICEGIKITQLPWLQPLASQACKAPQPAKLSLTDLQKRKELFHEVIYYIFDSILVPLIRSNFYVTESQTHRNRLFYFRHDVWRRLTQQPLKNLRVSMFEELKLDKANHVLNRRSLGYGSLRLLPKATGIRPIMNLRRRMMQKNTWAGKTRQFLGPSINTTVAPISNMLNYEKSQNPSHLGSGVLSIGDIYSRLKGFKRYLSLDRPDLAPHRPLYFVKLDIQSCFDTIPQERLIQVIEKVVSEQAYNMTKHVEMRPPTDFGGLGQQGQSKATRRFVGRATPAANPQHLGEAISTGKINHRRNTVFVDTQTMKEHNADDLLELLNEHINNNLVKHGREYFRQRNGIPQGSVLSSLLCNLFYAEMERDVLGFLQTEDALLLRLIDDFLLITSDSKLAMRFLHVMIQGQPAYGVSVNPTKSLVNFAATVDGVHIPRLIDTSLFPYCGNLINTHTLEIHRDHERVLEGNDSAAVTLANSLTVESARAPGRSFHRKIIFAFVLLMHPMYFDTIHNTLTVVLSNLYANFMTSAMKMYRYMRQLPGRAHPGPKIICQTIQDAMHLTHRILQRQGESRCEKSTSNVVSRSHVQYLAAMAFRFVLGRKQTRYATVLRWLDGVAKQARPRSDQKCIQLAQVVRNGNIMYGGWRF
ncbi:hypothetical protein FE257_004117 [Aspergillus nanangensis]|uniref:Telomerase reverse transcriptase n=1 Tax=Aspergillus nanangensis TaxID=2582783 RepID=A0AAD4CC14_ASPNN|nr:hypothetical protein FE257_004117 [Aspergillus nanangensis]